MARHQRILSGSGRPQTIMADAPFGAAAIAKKAGRGEEEQPPAPTPDWRLGPVNVFKDHVDLLDIGVEFGKPVARGALVVSAAPAPVLLDFEKVRKTTDQPMAWHDAAGEEMLRDPVRPVRVVEPVRTVAM